MFGKKIRGLLVNNKSEKSKKTSPQQGRRLTLESLESREMLSINPVLPLEVDDNGTAVMRSISPTADVLETATVYTELIGVKRGVMLSQI